ncbi:MAG: GMC family oxidoreductase N-terminal domain-containing protein [Microbacterium sp.]
MTRDRQGRRGGRRADLEADYIVVGAGSAGAALAARLSEDPDVSVLLLEAGPADRALELHVPAAFSKLFRGAYDWNYDTVPQPALDGRTIYWPRGKTLGGSSSLNAMMWVRGFAADYDAWAEVAGEGWAWKALAPYFLRVEDTEDAADPSLGRGGPQAVSRQRDPRPHTAAFLEAARELGHRVTEANLPTGQGFSQTMVSQHRGGRASTADADLRPARRRRRGNLRVVTDALVRRVTFAAAPPAEGALVPAEGALVPAEGALRARRASTSTSPESPATLAHDARSSSPAARSTPRSCSC